MAARSDDIQPEPLTDDDLFLMFREGQPDAFDCLFDRHYLSVYNFARTMLRDATDAEEILQETFLAVARAVKTYQPRGQFRTWLLRIVRNRCLNRIEAHQARRDVLAASSPAVVLQYPSPQPGPLQQAMMNEQTALIRQAIHALPDRQKEAIALYAFEQLTYQQIADVLDLPINTVKTLIHRARATLAGSLNGKLCDGRPEP